MKIVKKVVKKEAAVTPVVEIPSSAVEPMVIKVEDLVSPDGKYYIRKNAKNMFDVFAVVSGVQVGADYKFIWGALSRMNRVMEKNDDQYFAKDVAMYFAWLSKQQKSVSVSAH